MKLNRLCVLLLLLNCALLKKDIKISPSEFDYSLIAENYFTRGTDKPFPLTVQNGNNLYNSISSDTRYLFYSSDSNSNFDIFVRDLKSSVVVPITTHSASETKPSISPNGKFLVYVSEKNNSSGDLALIELNTGEYIRRHLNGDKKVLTEKILFQENNEEKDSYIDTDPTWSPDSKKIIFSSDRLSPGLQNILEYNITSKKLRALTLLGGLSPQISESGKILTYISFRDNSMGEVYILNLDSNIETRITNDQFINSSPTLSPQGEKIYYSTIRSDTNGNGRLDLNDNSLIVSLDFETMTEKNLTSDNFSIFDTKFSRFNKGSIIFSAGINNSINIYFIPEIGLVPKKSTIIEQFNFATSMKRKESFHTFFLALDSIELFFNKDPLFPIFQPRVLDIKAEEFKFRKDVKNYNRITSELEQCRNKPNWESGFGFYLKQINNEKNYAEKILEYYNTLTNSISKQSKASLLYTAAEDFETRSEISNQKEIYKTLISGSPDFYRYAEVKRKLAKVELKENSKKIPDLYFELLNNSEISIREKRKILSDVELGVKLDTVILNSIISEQNLQTKSKPLFELISFLKANELNKKRKFLESNSLIDTYLSPIPSPPPDCAVNPFCKKNLICQDDPICMKSHLLKSRNFQALGSPSKSFDEIRFFLENYNPEVGVEMEKSEVEKSFRYYENKAREYESRGDYRQTAFHYFFNVENMYLLKYKNLFVNDLYKDYAVYYQRKMVDSVLNFASKQAEAEKQIVLARLNLLGKENLNLMGKVSSILSTITQFAQLSKIFGDISDLENNDDLLGKPGEPDDAIKMIDQHFNLNRPRSRPVLYLASLYGYAYYLINKSIIYDEFFTKENELTEARQERILRDFKNAENELKWIIFADPLYSDAYQLLGWLYQYIALKQNRENSNREIFEKYFSNKNFEENINLYKQILGFLGNIENKKILSDLNLNLANNYHLLNNFTKAQEHYEIVERYGQEINPEIQFENYKQSAVFNFNHGKLLTEQGKYRNAIPYFKKAINLYDIHETNIKTSSRVLPNNLPHYDVHDKLVLLYTYLGLCFQEIGENVSSINAYKKALSLNFNSNYIENSKLYASLAYNYQKVEKYHLSNFYIEKMETEYSKKKNKFKFPIFSVNALLNSFLDSDKIRIIGKGRLPGELTNKEYYLLAKGLRIQNLSEQGEFTDAKEIITAREEFIKKENIHSLTLGEMILLNSKYKFAYDYFFTGNYLKALDAYDSLLDEVNQGKIKSPNIDMEKRKILKRKSYTAFRLFETETITDEKFFSLITDNIYDLKKQRVTEITKCLGEFSKKIASNELVDYCEKKIQKDWFNFDPLLGLSYFYLAEAFLKSNEYSLAYKYYGIAYALVKNPSGIEVDKIGLPGDLFSKTERLRLKSNLSSILLRVGEQKEFNELTQEIDELSTEFNLREDSIKNQFIDIKKLILDADSKLEFSRIYSELKLIEKKLYNNYYTLYEIDDEFIHDFFDTYQHVLLKLNLLKEIHAKEEKKYTTLFFKHFLNTRVIFEEKKLEGLNQSLREFLRKENHNIVRMKNSINSRIKMTENIKASKLNNQEIEKIIQNIKDIFPEKKRFVEISEETKPEKLNSDMAIIKIRQINENYLFHLVMKNSEMDFQFSNKLTIKDQLQIFMNQNIPNDIESITIIPDEKNAPVMFENFLPVKQNLKFAFLMRQLNPIKSASLSYRNKVFLNPNNLEKNQFREGSFIEYKNNRRLGASLYDSDILETSIFYSDGNIFSPSRKGQINLKEFAEKNSSITIVNLNNTNFQGLNYFQTLGAIESIQSANIPYVRLSQNDKYTDANPTIGISDKLEANKNTILNFAKKFERIGKFREALEQYNKIYNGTDNLVEKLILARVKSKAIPELKRFVFYERLIEQYENSKIAKLKIHEVIMSECYQNFSNSYCRDHLKKYKIVKDSLDNNSEKKESIAKINFYIFLNQGKLQNFKTNYETLLRLESNNDDFLYQESLVKFFTKNFILDIALIHSKKLLALAESPEEKEKANQYLNNINFQMYCVNHELPILQKTKEEIIFNGLQKNWNTFDALVQNLDIRTYDDSILKFRTKLYSYWRKIDLGEYVIIKSLSNEFTSTKKTIFTSLEENDKKLLFLLLKKSISIQTRSEANLIFEELIKSYSGGSIAHVEFMLVSYLEKLLEIHDNISCEWILTKYAAVLEKIKQPVLKKRYELFLAKKKFSFEKNYKDDSLSSLKPYSEGKLKSPNEYYKILNQFIESNKIQLNTKKGKTELLELINNLQENSVNSEEDSTEIFLDLSFFKDRIQYLLKNNLSIPKIEPITKNLQKKLPLGQNLIALINLGSKTYWFKLNQKEKVGEVALENNLKFKEEVFRYFYDIQADGGNKLLKDLIDSKFRNLLKLEKKSINYIYCSDFLFLSPLEYKEEDKIYYITRPDLLLSRNILKSELLTKLDYNIDRHTNTKKNSLQELRELEIQLDGKELTPNFHLGEESIFTLNGNSIFLDGKEVYTNLAKARKGGFLISNNDVARNSFNNPLLNESFQGLDTIYEGYGIINIYNQDIDSYFHFTNNLISKKDFKMDTRERFFFSINEQKIKFQKEIDWIGYRLYTNVIIESP